MPEPCSPTIMTPVRPVGAKAMGSASELIICDELVVADLDELVGGRDLVRLALVLDAGLDRLPERLLLDAGEEALDHAELHVGLEQRQAHLAQRGLDVFSLSSVSPARRFWASRNPLVSASNTVGAS